MVLVNAQVMVMVMVMSVVRTMVNFILDVKRLAYLSLYSIIIQYYYSMRRMKDMISRAMLL